MQVPYIVNTEAAVQSQRYATAYVKGKPYTVHGDHPNFDKIISVLYSNDHTGVEKLFDVVKALNVVRRGVGEQHGSGIEFDVRTGRITYLGQPIGGVIVDRLLELQRAGHAKPADKLLKFLENLYQNTSKQVIDRLYTFLEKGEMPITEDGYFLAYKKIRTDWTDVHSGTMDNSVGKLVQMPRQAVDDNDDRTCSTGLHFCSYSYLQSFSGERIVLLKINPKDVVSIPTDYNDAKGRCCEYLVIEEITAQAKEGHLFTEGNRFVQVAETATKGGVTSKVLVSASDQDEIVELLEDNADDLTNKQLVAIFNKLTGSNLVKFRDWASGVERISKTCTFEDVEEMVNALIAD